MKLETEEIGGFFEFDLSNSNQFPYPSAIRYHSARSAFYDLLKNTQVKKIWMPKFICDSMLDPLDLLDIEVCFYNLKKDFTPELPETLKHDEYLLYVNYFGVCTSTQRKLLERYPPEKIIFDHSQAFFVEPFDCFATIYSPRKFLPVAEGGLLIVTENFKPTFYARTADEMVEQYQYGLMRRVSTAAQAYEVFKDNEDKFSDCLPKKISKITEKMLESFDYSDFKKKRIQNFMFLHNQLGIFNQLKIDLNNIESPLTYPFLLNDKLAEILINSKVYTPTYWLDSLKRVSENCFENELVLHTTHLICDQRYSQKEMQFQIDKIKDHLI